MTDENAMNLENNNNFEKSEIKPLAAQPAEKKKLNTSRVLIMLGIVVFGLYLAYSNYPSLFDSITGHTVVSGSTTVDLFVMSQCPYGVMAENAFKPIMDILGKYVTMNIEFIGRTDGTTFESLHGQAEVDGDMIQACAKKISPQNYFKFILCQNENYQDFKSSVDKCAADAGIDAKAVNDCFTGEEGKALLTESFMKSEQKQVQGSPTIYIGGAEYNGKRDQQSLVQTICQKLNVPECADIPKCTADADCTEDPEKIGVCEAPNTKDAKCTYKEAEPIELIVLNDKECTSCDASKITTVLKQIFKGTQVKELDVSSEDGKNWITSMDIKYVPAFIYEKKVAETEPFKANEQLKAAFEAHGDYFKINDQATGASYLIDKEAKEKLKAMLSVGDKPQYDFFVMSYCPYGNEAEEAFYEVYKAMGDKVKFVPHYVVYSGYQGGGPQFCIDADSKYCSMHGAQEMSQNVREMCVYKNDGIGDYFKFVYEMNRKCSAQNADTCWEPIAKGLSLDTATIKKCQTDKAEEYSADELELNGLLSVRGSPTMFLNGQQVSDRTPAGLQAAACSLFDVKPTECSKTLSATSDAPQGAGCGS